MRKAGRPASPFTSISAHLEWGRHDPRPPKEAQKSPLLTYNLLELVRVLDDGPAGREHWLRIVDGSRRLALLRHDAAAGLLC